MKTTPGKLRRRRLLREIRVEQPRTGKKTTIPYATIKGLKKGPTLTVTAGVHADEYDCIEAARRLMRISPSKISGILRIIPVVNFSGFYERAETVCPIDQLEIFTAFPGHTGESISYNIARTVMDMVLEGDYAIDLHSGEVNETVSNTVCWFTRVGNRDTDNISKNMAQAFRMKYILDASTIYVERKVWKGPVGTMLYEASKKGVATIIAEAGGEGEIHETCVKALTDGVVNVMKQIGMIKGKVYSSKPLELRDLTVIQSKWHGWFTRFKDPGTTVDKGVTLGEVRDLEGNLLGVVKSPFKGVVHISSRNPAVKKRSMLFAVARLKT
ncbi:MAG: succinylglutamate desuccinylase/aspartoacylase family protein [Candidatus Bathyarchaeia archaeon]